MNPRGYLELIRADSDRLLLAASRNPGGAVPSCPGWTALDVVRHVGEVYEHKVLCMELGREPQDHERKPQPDAASDVAAWFTALRDTLLNRLAALGPERKSPTWFSPDQTVGFWFRRMAHETVVHRVDAELACGQETPLAPEFAVDGVDEFLGFLTHDFGDGSAQVEGADRTVALCCGGRQWLVTLRESQVERAAEGAVPDARIEGEPGDLLLHLWGRLPADSRSLVSSGDATVLAALQYRLRQVTQ
ncbi:maleylpyruvate isomerase family mycothiol-dependent enzyme [Streptomyces sp. NPDC005953]|uniref:maleylpyruvate isomerase family mycothiol-dependent enzyme n=1 Tax=Streptomyces sp. NPDC005953 TaxID=3156719 RepID=UPI0033C6C933